MLFITSKYVILKGKTDTEAIIHQGRNTKIKCKGPEEEALSASGR